MPKKKSAKGRWDLVDDIQIDDNRTWFLTKDGREVGDVGNDDLAIIYWDDYVTMKKKSMKLNKLK